MFTLCNATFKCRYFNKHLLQWHRNNMVYGLVLIHRRLELAKVGGGRGKPKKARREKAPGMGLAWQTASSTRHL